MSGASSNKVQQIVRAAIKLDSTARGRFLDHQCSDEPALRVEVEQLLLDQGIDIPPPTYDVLDTLAPDPPELMYKTIGPYEIVRVIARGGMGTIYEAREKRLQRRVALKCVHGGAAAARPDVLKRFELESQTLAHLHHPSIVPIYTSGRTPDGTPYYAMEYVPGEPLDEYVAFRELSLANRLGIFLQICDAVFHAHVNGVIHRDLKPSNILVTEDPSSTEARDSTRSKPLVKVVDFGLARVTNPAIGRASALSETRAFLGTIRYMSPEQATGDSSNTDARSDVYSLGVILFELVTNQLPYDLSERLLPNALSAICNEPPTRPRHIDPSLSGDIETILLKALEKEPSRRYQSSAAMGEDVERFLHGDPILAHPTSAAYQLWMITRRHRAIASTVAVFLVVVIGLTAWFMLQLKRERNLALESQIDAIHRAEEAERERTIAQGERDRARRLEDSHRLADLLRRADALWPARPAIIPDLEEWLVEAHLLVGLREEHEARLALLQERGIPLAHPEDAALDQVHRRIAEISAELAEDRPDQRGEELRDELATMTMEQATLERRIRAERRFTFESRDDQFWFDTLHGLVLGLDALANHDQFSNSVAGIRARLELADRVGRISIDEHAETWRETIATIADRTLLPVYDGLQIIEQAGLVPIGTDRRSGLVEFWHVATGDRPERDAQGDLVITPESGLVFVLLPGASFLPGAQRDDLDQPNYDPFALPDEMPPAGEFRMEPFFISKYEMTQAQWVRVEGKNPSYLNPDMGSDASRISWTHPVEHVSWTSSQLILSRLGLILPSEPMWEFACRAGTSTIWSCGDAAEALVDHARLALSNHSPQSSAAHEPVGQLAPNRFGLHDVHGNVAEWCFDRYSERIRAPSSRAFEPEPSGIDSPWRKIDQRRIFRGGGFLSPPTEARSSHRDAAARETQDDALGIRPARWLEQ